MITDNFKFSPTMILIAVLDDIDMPMGVIKYELSLFFFQKFCDLSTSAHALSPLQLKAH